MIRMNPRIKALIAHAKDIGVDAAIMDACHDRTLCKDIGVDYNAEDVYTQIRLMIENGGNKNGSRI